jgi:hypothetical protein
MNKGISALIPGASVKAEGTVLVYHLPVPAPQVEDFYSTVTGHAMFAENLHRIGFTQFVCANDRGTKLALDLTRGQAPSNAVPTQSTVAQSAPDVKTNTKVFGLEIGADLSLPECQRTKLSRNRFIYSGNDRLWCYERLDKGKDGTPVVNETIEIKFPFGDRPEIVSGLSLIGQILDGRLEGIGFNTLGVENAGEVLKKLTEKYGKPTVSQPVEVQNKMGARFTTVQADWNFSNLIVVFQGVASSLDSGLVTIDTPRCNAWRQERLKQLTDGRPL